MGTGRSSDGDRNNKRLLKRGATAACMPNTPPTPKRGAAGGQEVKPDEPRRGGSAGANAVVTKSEAIIDPSAPTVLSQSSEDPR